MIKDFKPQWYLGSILKINEDTLIADIDVFNTDPLKNSEFFGVHSSEIKIGDDVLVLMLSRELYLYTPLRVDSFLGLKKGTSSIDLTTQGTITIKAENVIVDSPSIKLGSNGAGLIPVTFDDVLIFSGTVGGQPATGTITPQSPPKAIKTKVE
jgi:hypothetical protein